MKNENKNGVKLDFIAIDEDRVKEILTNHRQLIDRIHSRLSELFEAMVDVEEIIMGIQLRSSQIDNVSGSSNAKRDLFDVLEQQQALQKNQSQTIRNEMWRLTKEEESINRVWICYHSLRSEEYEILSKMYVKKQPWNAVRLDLGVSQNKITRMRRIAVDSMLKLYNSDLTNNEIASNSDIYDNQEVNRKLYDKYGTDMKLADITP